MKGFVESVKNFGHFTFIVVRGLRVGLQEPLRVQYVVDKPLKDLKKQSYVECEGVLEENQSSKYLSYKCTHLEVLNPTVGLNLPGRTLQLQDCFLLRACLYKHLRAAMDKRKIYELSSPKLMPTCSEGGSELFKVTSNLLAETFYLSQSPQLYKQMAINLGLNKVYELGPIFRAEKFKTPRHLNETICWDLEQVTDNLHDLLTLISEVLVEINEGLRQDLFKVPPLTKEDFTVKSYKEVVNLLNLKDGEELTIDHEKTLYRLLGKYVFVTHYPSEHKPFYIHERESFDLLGPNGELCSGGLRENNYQKLKAQIIGTNGSLYENGILLGCPQSGGFGFGLDRYMVILMGEKNIKKTKVF